MNYLKKHQRKKKMKEFEDNYNKNQKKKEIQDNKLKISVPYA